MNPSTHGNTAVSLYSPTTDPIGALLSSYRAMIARRFVVGDTLLDLACGDNRLVRTLGFGVGVDRHPFKHVDKVVPDFSRLPFDNSSMSTVTILASLHYFELPQAVLNEVSRVLKPGGRLIISQPNPKIAGIWHKLRHSPIPRLPFSEAELQAMCRAASFLFVQSRPFMIYLNRLYIFHR